MASAGEQAGKAHALEAVSPANPPRRSSSRSNAAAEPSSPQRPKPKPDAAPGPRTSSAAAASMYPVKENLLPTRRIALPKAPAGESSCPAPTGSSRAPRSGPCCCRARKSLRPQSISMRRPHGTEADPALGPASSFKVAGVRDLRCALHPQRTFAGSYVGRHDPADGPGHRHHRPLPGRLVSDPASQRRRLGQSLLFGPGLRALALPHFRRFFETATAGPEVFRASWHPAIGPVLLRASSDFDPYQSGVRHPVHSPVSSGRALT